MLYKFLLSTLLVTLSLHASAQAVQCSEIYLDRDVFAEAVNRAPVDMVRQNGFRNYRGILEYVYLLPNSFLVTLQSLSVKGRKALWIDLGTGEGNALYQMRNNSSRDYLEVTLEYISAAERLVDFLRMTAQVFRPRGLGVTYKQENRPGGAKAWENGELNIKEGFFEEMTFKPTEKFDLGTDVSGVFEYSTRLDLVTAKAISLMNPGARLYIYAGIVEGRPAHMSMNKDYVEIENYKKVLIRDWFLRIKGSVKVELVENEMGNRLNVVITRTGNGKVSIPELEPIEPNLPMTPEKPRSRRAFLETGDLIEVDFLQ